MSGEKHHFQNLRELPSHLQKPVGGIGGNLTVVAIGDFVFNLEDDNGCVSTIRLPKSLYVPGLKFPLLCPQHWAQASNDNNPRPKDTSSSTLTLTVNSFGNNIATAQQSSIVLLQTLQ